jgi:hypothetical protein
VAIFNQENVKFGLDDHDFICGQHIYMFRRNPKKMGVFSFNYHSVGLVQAFEFIILAWSWYWV